jgi:SAM-dependent methyltransferase
MEVAHRRVSSYPNAHVIQADIFHLPLKTVFDMAFSIGVVHHTPDPMQATFSLASRVRSNGQLLIWVYGYENNWWIHFFVTPLRKYIFSNLPNWLTYAIFVAANDSPFYFDPGDLLSASEKAGWVAGCRMHLTSSILPL